MKAYIEDIVIRLLNNEKITITDMDSDLVYEICEIFDDIFELRFSTFDTNVRIIDGQYSKDQIEKMVIEAVKNERK